MVFRDALKHFSANPIEKEVLFRCGTKFKIIENYIDKNNISSIILEEVQNGRTKFIR